MRSLGQHSGTIRSSRSRWLFLLLSFLCFLVPVLEAQSGFNGPGRYAIMNANSGKVLDLDRNDGTTVIQFESRNTDNQTWDVQRGPNGLWVLRNVMNGNALDASGPAKGGQVRGTAFSRINSQFWRIDAGAGGAAVLVANNGGVLDVPDSSRRDGARLQTWERNDTSAQQWQFQQVGGGHFAGGGWGGWTGRSSTFTGGFSGPGRYEITNVNSGKVLDMDRNDRSTILQYESRHTDNQTWELRNAGQGLFYLINSMNGNALEATGDGKGVPPRATPFRGLDSQKWRIESTGDGFVLISCYGNVLDVPDGHTDNGVHLQLWERNNSKAQQWNFSSAGGFGGGRRGAADSPLTPNRYGTPESGDRGALTPNRESVPANANPPFGGAGRMEQGRFSQGDAVDACQNEIRRKLRGEFGDRAVSFRSTETSAMSAAQTGVRGRGDVGGRGQHAAFEYQCTVNTRAGRVLSATYRTGSF